MSDYNARVELDSRDFDAAAIDVLMDVVEDYAGTVARSLTGRVELIYTLPADSLRQATSTALAIAQTAGHTAYSVEVMPTEEFHRRALLTPVPEFLSASQAAEVLDVSRQRVLQLINGGQLEAIKVGDTWIVPRSAATARAAAKDTAGHEPIEVVSYP